MQQFMESCDDQMEQIFSKYRLLLADLNANEILNEKRTPRKNAKKSKRKSNFRLRQFGSALFDVMENNKRDLFTCPLCRKVLNVPITIECGHTFCYDCLRRLGGAKCCECLMDFGPSRCVNVLIQEIVNKWKEMHGKDERDHALLDTEDLLGLEPRYCLRSRYAGLTSRNGIDEAHIDKIFRRLLRSSKRTKRLHNASCKRKPQRTPDDGNPFDAENCCQIDRLKHIINRFFVNVGSAREEVLKTTWNHVNVSDLECILCSQCYLDPVTTACGHTFCRGCLARVLDHGLACPLCMASLDATEQSRGTTYILDQALKMLVPREYDERLMASCQEIQLTDKECQVAVFVCTNAFPGVACPLYVYEPRYRLLARRCLQSVSRRFAMVARTDNAEKFSSYGTILEVKDAVHLHDGRSILTTVGVRRFKVLEKGEEDGYDTAKVQYIRDNAVPSERFPELMTLHQRVYSKAARWVRSLTPRVLAEVESSIGQMPSLENDWPSLPDGPAWAWWLMPILPLSSQLQVGFLSTTNLEKRLRAIDKMLEHMKVRMKALERNTLNCTDTDDSSDSCRFWLL